MNSPELVCVALLGSVTTVFADPTDRVIIAAMRLSEQPNYSWFTTVDGESSSYEIEGKTTAAGITWIKMPMIAAIGRGLGRESDKQLEALFHGKSAGVVLISEQWKSVSELSTSRAREAGTPPMVRGSANAGNFGIRGGPSVGAAAPFLEDNRRNWPLDGLQLGVTHPHEELAIIVSSFTKIDLVDEVVTGTLTPIGAALLLVRAEQKEVEPLATSGNFKLWLKSGAVIKYQLNLEGVVMVGRWKKKEVRVNSTTSLKDAGTTNVIVPAEAHE